MRRTGGRICSCRLGRSLLVWFHRIQGLERRALGRGEAYRLVRSRHIVAGDDGGIGFRDYGERFGEDASFMISPRLR